MTADLNSNGLYTSAVVREDVGEEGPLNVVPKNFFFACFYRESGWDEAEGSDSEGAFYIL